MDRSSSHFVKVGWRILSIYEILFVTSGQGGTPFEKVVRVAADTLKIVETAHEAEFVLRQVYLFPHHLFQQYYQVGYRDLQKGFNTEVSQAPTTEIKISQLFRTQLFM